METSSQPEKAKEQWIFSLYLPHTDQKVIQITTTHQSTSEQNAQTSFTSSDDLDDDDDDEVIPETKSLLDNDDEVENENGDPLIEDCCWRFASPLGLTLHSNILLQLSYRPSWQGIPEYTRTKRQRAISRTLGCCCQSTDDLDEEQVWEIYTTEHIVKTEKTKVTIRGMGKCQAIRVYFKPLLMLDEDEDEDTHNRMRAPTTFQSALNVHRQRVGQQEQAWSRFTEPEDSLPKTVSDSRFIILTFAVPIQTDVMHDPPLLWKVDLPPRDEGLLLDTITVLDGAVDLQEPATHVYIQGYQSWSFTGSISKGKPQPKPALPDMFSRAFNFGGSKPTHPTMTLPVVRDPHKNSSPSSKAKEKKGYQSDFFTCITTGRDKVMDEISGSAFLCGWLSQHQQFGVISVDEKLHHVEMHAAHHAHLPILSSTSSSSRSVTSTDWAYGQLVAPHHYDEEPMVHFLHAAAAYNQAKPLQNGPLLTGWCSWYHYYENISAANLRNNFAKLASMKTKVPTNVVVVDDGYMTAWGDWDSFKPKKFTDMEVVCRDIQSHGMRPGLWLAPFACDKHSKLVQKHPEWIIWNDRGRPANSSNCGKFFYGLDATNPQVREHAFRCVRRAVQDWGFKVLKIDFLYAACLEGNGKYDMSMTRAQAMHLALQTIREAAGPDVFLIGCGCPVGTAIGYVDGMRVSADTGPTWYPALPLPWWDHGTLPALRAMIRNSINRAPMGHRWWHNDPDCLLLGETTSLNNHEVASAASIVAMTCGMMLLSDDLTKMSIARMRILTKIFPMTGVSGVVLDLHTAENDGMPSMLRLWCTDKYNSLEQFRRSENFRNSSREENPTTEATYFGRQSSFNFDRPLPHPNERKRSCIHVAKGLGTWTVISLSNWDDRAQLMRIPRTAVESAPETGWRSSRDSSTGESPEVSDIVDGYHIFSFWSGRYTWMVGGTMESDSHHNNGPLNRHLEPHTTEIFHIRPVTPGVPQYIGSDLHFSCGYEVLSFDASQKNKVLISLKTDLNRIGHIYLFVPTVDISHVRVLEAGDKPGRWAVVGNTPNEGGSPHCCGRVLRITVVVHADGSPGDGEIAVDY